MMNDAVQDESSPLQGCQEYDLKLTWEEVTVKVKKKRSAPDSVSAWLKSCCDFSRSEDVTILDNVTGNAQSGDLVAVMGSSGSGKTSLLATVSRRIKGNVTGKILLCGHPIDSSVLTKISGFVPQRDIVVESLIAKEHLQFMSYMRLDREVRTDVRNKWIAALLVDLNLAGCENTPICALSGGERRRLSLAVELLTDPPLLFCDEPTTGLDSHNASTVVEKLRQLASRGKTIICSIHQPASDTLSYFHKVILMACGHVAFQGTLSQADTFFSTEGFVCPPSYNPAEFYIKQLSAVPGEEDSSNARIQQLCGAYAALQSEQNDQQCNTHRAVTEISNDFQKYITIRKPFWHMQVYWLMWRSLKDSRRNKSGHAVQISVFLVTSLILSLCFMNSEHGTQSWIQDIRGLLYLITSEVFFTSAYCVFNTFPREIPVFLRESDLYSASAYYFSNMLSMIPRAIVEPLIYFAIIFVAVDFANESFYMFLLLAGPIVMISNSATAYGCMISALFESPDLATVVSVPLDLISLIMAGIFYNVRVLPASIRWLKYVSQFYYSNEALAVVHWQNVLNIQCPNSTDLPCLENGQQVLDEYGFEVDNLTRDLAVLAGFFVVLHFIGFLGVLKRSRKIAAY